MRIREGILTATQAAVDREEELAAIRQRVRRLVERPTMSMKGQQ